MPLKKSGRITLGQIYNEFKPQINTAKHSIEEYYRGGGNVPDIFENSNIPVNPYRGTSRRVRVNWSDYYGGTVVPSPYATSLPPINENDFWRHCEGSPNYWSSLQDNWKQYVTRKDGAYCVRLEVSTPYARIKIGHAEISIDTELGEDSGYEKLLRNTNMGTDYFPFGEWTMTIPRKITRFRIVATAGGGSGSVQKITANNDALKGDLDPIHEDGYSGGAVLIAGENLSVRLNGGKGGRSENSVDAELTVSGSASVDTAKRFRYANNAKEAKLYGEENTFEPGYRPIIFPDPSKRITGQMDWFGSSNYPINMIWKSDRQIATEYSADGGDGKGGDSIWSQGDIAAAEHPNQSGPVEPTAIDWGVGGAAGQHAQRGAMTQGGTASSTVYLGDFETSPGDDISINVPEGGVQSINLYTDYNQTDADNFTPSLADKDQYANHPVYGTDFYVGSSYVSKSGKGGDGFVQIYGATGRAYSEMTHSGIALLDEDYNIINQKFNMATSIKGVNSYNPAFSLPFEVDVIGTENYDVPKIFYVAYTGRIRKNGLVESKTVMQSNGCEVTVTPIAEQLVSRAPATATSTQNVDSWYKNSTIGTPWPVTNLRKSLYMEPDFSSEEPLVTGRVGSSSEDDFEDVPNVFADTCSITFEHTGLPNSVRDHAITLEFVKHGITDMGIGPERITFADVSTGETKTKTVEIGVGEEYFCATQNIRTTHPTDHIVSYPVTDKINYLFGHLKRARLTLAQCREDINLGGEPTPVDPPSDTIQIQYDMIGGGQGGSGLPYIANDDGKTAYAGQSGFYGTNTVLSLNGVEVVRTPNNSGHGVTLSYPTWTPAPNRGKGGRNSNYNTRGMSGGEESGTLEVQAGDILSFVIGTGGAGGREHANNGYEGLDGSDSPTYYNWRYGQRGTGGGIEIQGTLYTESGSHTVTDANRPTVPVEYNMISGGSGGQGQGYHTGDIGEGPGSDPFVGHFGNLGAIGTASSITNLRTLGVIEDTGTSAGGVAPLSAGNAERWNGQMDPSSGFAFRGFGEGGQNRQFGVQRYSSESQLSYSAKAGVDKSGTINLPVGTQIQVIVGTGGRGGNANNTGVNIPIDFGNPGGEGEGPQTFDWRLPSYPQQVQYPDGYESDENYPFHNVGGTFSKSTATAGQPTYSGGNSKIDNEWSYMMAAWVGGRSMARSVGRGEDGTNGAVIIQGQLYTENAIHTVTGGVPVPDPITQHKYASAKMKIVAGGGQWWIRNGYTYFSCSVENPAYGNVLGTHWSRAYPPPPPYIPPPIVYPSYPSTSGGGDGPYQHGPISSVRVGNTWHNTYAHDFVGPVKDPRGLVDINGKYSDGSDGGGGGGKIVCTAMNEAYGFGSFRNKIWLTHSAKHLTKAHQVGYHALFLPLINLGYKKDYKFVRNCLENIARHRTVDIYYQDKGSKRDLLGRIYRFALEPLCYVVGKIILFKRGKNEN